MRQLAGFSISAQGDDIVLRLQDEAGEVSEFAASPDQLDSVVEALDGHLAHEEVEFYPAPAAAAFPQRRAS